MSCPLPGMFLPASFSPLVSVPIPASSVCKLTTTSNIQNCTLQLSILRCFQNRLDNRNLCSGYHFHVPNFIHGHRHLHHNMNAHCSVKKSHALQSQPCPKLPAEILGGPEEFSNSLMSRSLSRRDLDCLPDARLARQAHSLPARCVSNWATGVQVAQVPALPMSLESWAPGIPESVKPSASLTSCPPRASACGSLVCRQRCQQTVKEKPLLCSSSPRPAARSVPQPLTCPQPGLRIAAVGSPRFLDTVNRDH